MHCLYACMDAIGPVAEAGPCRYLDEARKASAFIALLENFFFSEEPLYVLATAMERGYRSGFSPKWIVKFVEKGIEYSV